jgi:hypothetical protein
MLQPLTGFFLDLSGWPAAPILVAAIVMASTVVPLMAFRAMSPRLLRGE